MSWESVCNSLGRDRQEYEMSHSYRSNEPVKANRHIGRQAKATQTRNSNIIGSLDSPGTSNESGRGIARHSGEDIEQ